MTSSPLLTHVSSLVSLGYSPRFSSLFILIMSQLNIMRPFVYKPRPFLSYFPSLYKEEQKEILKTLTLYVMRKEDQSEDDIINRFSTGSGPIGTEFSLTAHYSSSIAF